MLGISARQLYHWLTRDERLLDEPKERNRIFSVDDILKVRALAHLMKAVDQAVALPYFIASLKTKTRLELQSSDLTIRMSDNAVIVVDLTINPSTEPELAACLKGTLETAA